LIFQLKWFGVSKPLLIVVIVEEEKLIMISIGQVSYGSSISRNLRFRGEDSTETPAKAPIEQFVIKKLSRRDAAKALADEHFEEWKLQEREKLGLGPKKEITAAKTETKQSGTQLDATG
jgi:hypothetical protein